MLEGRSRYNALRMVIDMTRHQMREYAFMLTFERLFNTDDAALILETARECETVEVTPQVEALFYGIEEKKQELDERISRHLKSWTIDRISRVSLAVLRVAVYEIMFCEDMDIDISISEAIKIAQEYTVKDDVSFVNGVLSSISKEEKGV